MTRDMSDREFKAALARNDFQWGLIGVVDKRTENRVMYGALCTVKGKVLKRATLARALRERERDENKRANGEGA